MNQKNWHKAHEETSSFGQKLSDKIASGMGSWKFIIWQSVIVIVWMILNIIAFFQHWDPYPFILLNLIFSTQAAYAAPIIMMSQNRQNQRDRLQADNDYKTNLEAKEEIEALALQINKLETEKLDVIIKLLKELKS